MDRKSGNVVIVRRKKVVAGGHHGGAWKVAYADFVTAMMAFFLLMWLLSVTDEETRLGLADYFSPTIPIHETPRRRRRAVRRRQHVQPGRARARRDRAEGRPRDASTCRGRPDESLYEVEQELLGGSGDAMEADPLLKHIRTRITDEGLIIEVFDIEGSPLFDGPTAEPEPIFERPRRDDRPGAVAHGEPGGGDRPSRDRRRRPRRARSLAALGRPGAARPRAPRRRPASPTRGLAGSPARPTAARWPTTRASRATGGSRSRCCAASRPRAEVRRALPAPVSGILSPGRQGCAARTRPRPTPHGQRTEHGYLLVAERRRVRAEREREQARNHLRQHRELADLRLQARGRGLLLDDGQRLRARPTPSAAAAGSPRAASGPTRSGTSRPRAR